MLGGIITLSFFLIIGIAWRFVKPGGVGADAMQRALTGLIHWLFLPLAVFFIMRDLPLNHTALTILLYVAGTTILALALAWVWLWKTKLPGRTKGALLIAAGFGNVLFVGIPVNKIFFPDWTMRVAVEYGLVANVLLLFTVGAVLVRSFSEGGKSNFGKAFSVLKDFNVWLKEPLVWATLLALVLNIANVVLPAWIAGVEASVFGALVALLLISVGLSLRWSNDWFGQKLADALPAAVIQLILVPLIMWGMVSLFGSVGAKSTLVLLLGSMLPASVLGFAFCERFKLDTAAYALAFTATSVLAIATVPLMGSMLL